MSDNINNTSEEVDLGKLFKLIGDGFRNMFSSIAKLFSRFFHYIIISIIFIKTNFIKIAIATLLGAVLGYVLEMNDEPVFQSDAILETNFGSGKELYNQTNNLNYLLGKEDYKSIAEKFNISIDEAKTILGFNIEPFEKNKSLIKEFDYYKQHTDTIYTRDLTPEVYAKRLQDEDYRLQKITALSFNQDVFNKLNKGISKISENEYFNKVLNLKVSELNSKKDLLKKNLIVIDSIREVYKKVALLSAKNENSSATNINFSDKKNSTNSDIELFKQTNSIMYQLKSVNEDIIRSGFIVNTISEFGIGYQEESISNKKWFKYGVLAGLLMILSILGLKFNKYLDRYNKSK